MNIAHINDIYRRRGPADAARVARESIEFVWVAVAIEDGTWNPNPERKSKKNSVAPTPARNARPLPRTGKTARKGGFAEAERRRSERRAEDQKIRASMRGK